MPKRKKVSRFIDVPAWMGWNNITLWSNNIQFVVKNLFIIQKSEIVETFDEATIRLEMTKDDIRKRQREFYLMACFYGALAFAAYAYCGWLLSQHYYRACALSIVLALVMTSFWFKEHFWYTQMREQRLGLSIPEWFRISFLGYDG